MFMMSSPTGMTLEGLAIKCNQAIGVLGNWDIYYRPNNYQLVPGANTSSVGWTLLSSTTGVPSLGATDYTYIALGLSLVIPPGATYSFYIAPVGTTTHQYATTAIGTTTASNANASLIAGNRGSSLFNCGTNGGMAVVKMKYSLGCIGPRVPVIATVAPNPTVTATPSSITVCSGDNVTLNGGGADTYSWTGGITDNTPFVATTTTTYEVTGTDANGCTNTATAVVTVNNCNTTLNLTALIQGYWLGTEMSEVLSFQSEPTTLGACDSIDVSLVDSATLNVLVTKRAVLNKNGLANVVFPGSFTGSYYIKLAHRNAMETWSKYTVSMSGTPSYNFTTAADQAYGDNQVEVSPGIFALYSGDIIKDANEAIELTDIAQLESDNSNFAFGYQASDINGDGGVDLGDFPLVEANVNGFIFANHP
jgi:hypothetical protein